MSDSLSTERWKRMDQLFSKAFELPADQVAAYLDRECHGDTDLRQEVEALLAESARSSGLQTQGWASPHLARDLAANLTRHTLEAGTVVGAYRVTSELGRGGMAVVYAAERIDGGFDQQVALKVIKRGLDSEELLRRFLVERQILASLDHPNIARLLDGGITEDGRPFFAMEAVEGLPIDQYSVDRKLPLADRLRLFIEAGQGVEAAHRRLVVHRDLKPSNLLVTTAGTPKLLDFGIAKLLTPDIDAPGADHQTQTSIRLLTPEYASPEQMRGEAVTTATDVYQLGVLLYLLLTGQNPHRTKSGTISEIEHAVCQQEPTRPSAAPDASSAIEVKRLRGDLDNIVLKALHKVPEKRYRSVAHMMDDLERHLDHRPVSARAPSISYYGSRWIVRHKTVVFAALGLLALTALYGLQLVAERARAERAAARAERAAARAQQTVVALERLFGDFDPFAARGGQVTVRELLDRATANVERDLAEQPEVQARLRVLLGNLYHKLGAQEPALAVAQKALTQSEALYGPDHPAVGLAAIAAGNALSDQGRFGDARPLLERAVQVLDAHPEAQLKDLTEALGRLSRLAWVFREHDRALALSGRALALQESAVGPEDPSIAALLYDRAEVFLAMDQPRDAVPLLQRAADIWHQTDGEDSARCGQAWFLLARATARAGNPQKALPILQRAIAATESVLGDRHSTTGDLWIELGVLLAELGHDDESLARLRQGFALHHELHGRGFPATLRSAGRLGLQLKKVGLFAEAQRLYTASLASLEESFGERSPHLYSTLSNLAESMVGCGDLEAGLAFQRRALDSLQQTEQADPLEIEKTLDAIANLQSRTDSPINNC